MIPMKFLTTLILGCTLIRAGHLPAQTPTLPDPPQRSMSDKPAEFPGTVLQLVEERRIPSLVPGVIKASHVTEGSLLAADDLVMEIDSRQAELELKRLTHEHGIAVRESATTVELDYTRRSIEVAEAELSRAMRTNLRQPNAIARSEIDQLTLMVEKAIAENRKTEFEIGMKKMQIDVRAVELNMGQQKLNDCRIVAPMQAMVVEIMKKPGEWVQASETVARVARLDRLKVEVRVPAELAVKLVPEQKATFIPELKSLREKTFTARVMFVHPAANPVNELVRVWVEVDNPDLLLIPGLKGKLVIDPGL